MPMTKEARRKQQRESAHWLLLVRGFMFSGMTDPKKPEEPNPDEQCRVAGPIPWPYYYDTSANLVERDARVNEPFLYKPSDLWGVDGAEENRSVTELFWGEELQRIADETQKQLGVGGGFFDDKEKREPEASSAEAEAQIDNIVDTAELTEQEQALLAEAEEVKGSPLTNREKINILVGNRPIEEDEDEAKAEAIRRKEFFDEEEARADQTDGQEY